MPEMYEIYKKYAETYDELVSAEDYKDNLGKYLRNKIDWNKKIIYEAGIGTGRITKYYISKVKHCYGFDREQHMLNRCKTNHIKNSDKMTLNISENLELKAVDKEIDVFIEGWSFGHTINQNSENLKETIELLICKIKNIVKKNGDIFLIESLGTNVDEPIYYNDFLKKFYTTLEENYGFERTTLRTDYKYRNYEEASRIMGFFFGDEMKSDIYKNEKTIIKEFTGVWHLNNKK